MTDRTCVFGATGFVGRALVQALSAAGEHVRAASRHGEGTEGTIERVACDLERADTLVPVLAGCRVAYYLVHSLGRADFREIDRRCARNVAAIAAEAGCSRIIYLGGVAPRGRPSEHLASRLEVGEILRAGRVRAVELRASMIIGNGSASWRILRDLAARLPFMVFPRWLDSKTCPIALPDVVTALLDARDVPLDESAWFGARDAQCPRDARDRRGSGRTPHPVDTGPVAHALVVGDVVADRVGGGLLGRP